VGPAGTEIGTRREASPTGVEGDDASDLSVEAKAVIAAVSPMVRAVMCSWIEMVDTLITDRSAPMLPTGQARFLSLSSATARAPGRGNWNRAAPDVDADRASRAIAGSRARGAAIASGH